MQQKIMQYRCKPLEEIEHLEQAAPQHCHCTWWLPQQKQKEKDGHHYQHLVGQTGHNN